MRRLNFLQDDPWDESERRHQPCPCSGTRSGQIMASLIEYLPRAPDSPMHMHYGVEEMFFVLRGTPTVRTPRSGGAITRHVVYFRKAETGCTRSRTPRTTR